MIRRRHPGQQIQLPFSIRGMSFTVNEAIRSSQLPASPPERGLVTRSGLIETTRAVAHRVALEYEAFTLRTLPGGHRPAKGSPEYELIIRYQIKIAEAALPT